MYKRMLVPLDTSDLAEVVLPYARELALRLDIEGLLLHVCDPHSSESPPMCQNYIQLVTERTEAGYRDLQAKTGVTSKARALTFQGKMLTGHPAEEIISCVKDENIDFILMATHGRSGIKRWFLGSTADKVLRASPVPVWLVRAGVPEEIVHDEWPNRKILVTLDGSKLAESVLPHVKTLAKQRGAELLEIILIRVTEDPFVTADYPEASMKLTWSEHVKQFKEHFRQEAENYLEAVRKQLAEDGLNVQTKVLMGETADKIIDFANTSPPNLIVMATHGRSGVIRLELGSVADKVLHGVSSPIFLVRPQ